MDYIDASSIIWWIAAVAIGMGAVAVVLWGLFPVALMPISYVVRRFQARRAASGEPPK